MANLKVVVPLLNKRTFPVENTADKSNVVGSVKLGFQFESVAEVTNALGNWYQDRDGYYYWGGGVEENHGIKPLPWWISDFGIDKVWNYTRGEGVTIVTLDTGLFTNVEYKSVNNFERKSILNENDLSDNDGHGTLMASIIAGNGKDIYGVAPDSDLISMKIFSDNSQSSSNRDIWEYLIRGLELFKTFDKTKTYIMNLSCAGYPNDSVKMELQNLVNDIRNKFKIVFVCAVGNDSDKTEPFPVPIPARLDNVISVAGFYKDGYKRLNSSNYWPEIHISCPGEYDAIKLKVFFPELELFGSSHACAYASGLISLFLSKRILTDGIYNEICKWLEIITEERTFSNNSDYKYRIPNKEKLLSIFNQKTIKTS